ncbi:MAG: hypothetical protein JNK30_15130 [Phenylobacterium sp.]|uniref:hypothetical protein n=1 Tax=Phenylobacterium sp. TaxID=1871053 RepID=UPI001A40EAB2|nr:hypothetical protein [Phenylobacterium sp.]MBL8772715.1 hypothetical protein [Phenylobacterium sp.]
MLVTIVAAAAMSLAPDARPAVAAQTLLDPGARAPKRLCTDAGRLQVSHERALLYRPDPNERVKKLIEMPMGEPCLLGGSR